MNFSRLADTLVPGVQVHIDSSGAVTSETVSPWNLLIIGESVKNDGKIKRILSPSKAKEAYESGPLVEMLEAVFKGESQSLQVYALSRELTPKKTPNGKTPEGDNVGEKIVQTIGQKRFKSIVLQSSGDTLAEPIANMLSERWQGSDARDGHLFFDTQDSLETLVNKKKNAFIKNPHVTIFATHKALSKPHVLAAAKAAALSASAMGDPAIPLNSLLVPGVKGQDIMESYSKSERNTLLKMGYSTLLPQDDNSCVIERCVTTRLQDESGNPATDYQDLNTKFIASHLREDLSLRLKKRFARFKLSKGLGFVPDGDIATPERIKSFIVKIYNDWIQKGYIEDEPNFIESLKVDISSQNANRVNILLKPDFMNQANNFAVIMAFIK